MNKITNTENENRNKKLVFITVGTGKDGSDVAHGIFFSIKNHNPDYLVLIGSSESFNITLPHLKDLIAKWGKNIEHEEKIIEEINDFEKLHNNYSELIKSFIKEGYRNQEIVVDYTSGTKAMSAALITAGLALEVGTISYVFGDRKEGKVQSGTERISLISPTSIFSEKVLNQSIFLFNSYRFESAIELIRNFEFHPVYKNKSEFLFNLSNFFSLWDKFNFKESFNLLKNLHNESLLEFQLKDKFEKIYIPLLSKLKEDNLSYEKIDDLVFNSNRRNEEGKYDDAVARLYRALEMVGQFEFEKEFKCKTDNILIQKLDENIKTFVIELCKKKDKEKIQAGLLQVFKILNEKGNTMGKLFIENFAEIRKLLDKRNYSILAHGNKPITKDNFQKFYSFITSTFKLADKGDRNNVFAFPSIKSTKL